MKFSLVVYKKILFTFSVELEEIFPFVIVLLFGGRQTKSEKKDDGKNEIKSLINHYKDLTKTILIKRQQSEEKNQHADVFVHQDHYHEKIRLFYKVNLN